MEQVQIIQNKIYEIRGQRVMLDRDLAEMYGVGTKRLNEAVKRNKDRFDGDDFMFQLTLDECNLLINNSRSQIATLNSSRGHNIKYTPFAFTEQGVAMLSSVLRSKKAIEINRGIMRAFVSMKTHLAAHQGDSSAIEELRRRVEALEQSRPILGAASTPLPLPEPPLPEYLSDGVKVVDYSPRALAIFTEATGDRQLLKSLGARYNGWLTWGGERVAGWVFPKSCSDRLFKHLPLVRKIHEKAAKARK